MSTPTCEPTPPAPAASGITGDCCKYHFVEKGDTCDDIETEYGILDLEFRKLNPMIDVDCFNLIIGLT
jgi:hypothetical protein